MLRNMRLHAVSAALLAFGISGAVSATDTPSNGLGQSWPNATDVSANPHWHVYVFTKDGVRYVQVNDNNGGVRSAIATAAGQVLVLPIGRDAQNVTTTDPTTAATDSSETVYDDGSVQIKAATTSTGVTAFKVAAVSGCDDPVECNNHIAPTSP